MELTGKIQNRGGKHTFFYRRAGTLLAVLLLTGACGIPAEAAVITEPRVITEKGQTIDDDFDVTIDDGTTKSVLTITSGAASSRDDEITVHSKSIQGHFTKENTRALGIHIQDKHPGKVILADGIHVGVNAELNVVDKVLDVNALRTSEFGKDLSSAKSQLILGDDVHLQAAARGNCDHKIPVQLTGAYLRQVNFFVGNGLTLETSLTGTSGIPGEGKIFNRDMLTGLYTRAAKGIIGSGILNRITITGQATRFIDGIRFSGWGDQGDKKDKEKDTSWVTIGEGSRTGITVKDSKISGMVYGIYAESNSKASIGKNGSVSIMQQGGFVKVIEGLVSDKEADLTVGANFHTSIRVEGENNQIKAIRPMNKGAIHAGDGLQVDVSYTGSTQSNTLAGASAYDGTLVVGNDSRLDVIGHNTGNVTKGTAVRGLLNTDSTSTYGNSLSVTAQGENYNMVEGLDVSSESQDSSVVIGDGLAMQVKASTLSDNAKGPTVRGIQNGIQEKFQNNNKVSSAMMGRNAAIILWAPENVQDVAAIHSYGSGKTEFGDGVMLVVNSQAKANNNVVKADTKGIITFDGGMTLSGNQNAIYSTGEGSSVTAVGEGRKVILGNLESADKGVIRLKLNTSDSLFRGASTVNGGDTALTLANGALWDMTDSSTVTKLDHRNGGIVNMAYNKEYQTLKIGNFSGQDGTFRMKTDLDSQTDGDKVYMTSAEAGSKGLVQVHDESFLKGKEVTGTKHLLLITDDSKNATFSGLTLDDGGLWDVTPTIQNGQYVHNVMGVADANDKQWYLTKLEKKVNKDTIPLMKAADNSYALYRLDIDSLRKRMGDLRFRNMKDDSGLWARDFHGAYEGQGTDSRYNGFQLGYDYAANEKSLYGFFAERTISNPKYSYGSSKDHGLSGGLYGTWYGDSGVYTDVVAKWGRNDTELHTRGGWPDSANYRTRSESLSVEWGKTFTRDDGLFLEPEAQMVFGRLGSKDYTTSRGRTVHMGSYDSAIGRLGILLGKRVTEGDHPYDYYLKFSLLHEFGGERNFHLAAPDGETMDYSEDYRDTWQEAGFGGTWHINGNTSIYADAERSFGGNWHKKWQWNLGINWQF
ncbi:autotransporter outer membrane beta-barrel domain-containing protein [Dialister succinatiphilus]|uniref:autotransporter outer membrane beta-barrel domain-containing protein n=1 Tax=Dialister succinatiphilus TaxID=487173 RepID=UPI00402A53C9